MYSDIERIILTEIRRKGRLFFLLFSNGFEIRATKGTIDKLNLTAGAEFSEMTFAELKTILENNYAYYTAESMLARRPFSIGEFKDRLRRKEISESLIVRIVRDYRSKELLDDYRYAAARVQSLLNRKPAGRGFLIADLQRRLVPRTIAEEVVDNALSHVDEVDIALRLLEKRQAAFAKFDLETMRRKAYNYLSRRAISYRAAKAAFEKLFGNRKSNKGG